MTKRICIFCHKVGITVEFDNGNQLRKHVKVRHPRSRTQIARDRQSLRQYRKQLLLMQVRYRAKDYPL